MDRCPYCRSEISQSAEMVACSDCGSRYHIECWRNNNGCSVFACRGRMITLSDGGISRVYSASLLPLVQNIRNVLELNGISCSITNQYLSTAVGEIPPIECWPQLWVRNEDFPRAKHIINAMLTHQTSSENTWICPKCNEQLEGQFTECWNCGASRS